MNETIREFENWLDACGAQCKARWHGGKWHVVVFGQIDDRTTRSCFVSHQNFALACTAAQLAFEAGSSACATG